MNAEVYCITHKKIPFKIPQGVRTVSVAASTEHELFAGSGSNINDRNDLYSEISAIHWLIENREEDLRKQPKVGICHYRRFFCAEGTGLPLHDPGKFGVSSSIMQKKLDHMGIDRIIIENDGADVIAPIPVTFGMSLYEQYHRSHPVSAPYLFYAFQACADVGLWSADFANRYLFEKDIPFFPYNMSIMNTQHFIDQWSKMIDALQQLERRAPAPVDPYQRRYLAFIGERLHSCLIHNLAEQGSKVVTVNVACIADV